MTSKQIDTKAESTAAEQLVVAELGLRGLLSGIYPRSFPDVDVFAFDRDIEKIVKIQVKYRHAAGASYAEFRSGSLGPVDFVVLIRANQGEAVGGRKDVRQIWVLPSAEVDILLKRGPGKDRITFSTIADRWLAAWDVIVEYAKHG